MTAPISRERILPRRIQEEMQQSFINYSMSVIVSRALPDVRDGLKPVHRRILYAMNELGLIPTRPYKKAATVVGDVLGKYHPHGDSSVYDALVRMVQTFSLRYPLIDGQGNFGSVDGDPAAAYRYTEARLTRFAITMLEDIDKNTVDTQPNFDDRLQEPTVLPSKVPNLLVNGSSGIAVGMATNIPPHNLREIAAAVKLLIDNPEATTEEICAVVSGPDFPTAAFIYGKSGIRDAYETGRGRLVLRARVHTEEKESTGRSMLVITELPYQVNKANLAKTIAELASDKKVDGVSGVRDESDRDGMRLVVELKRDANPKVVLNQLYKQTQLQTTFGVIMLALDNGAPKVMGLKTILERFVTHRHEIVVRRTQFDLDGAKAREHILDGLKIAVDNIDEVIKIIRGSADSSTADAALRARFGFSEKQSEAILNMRLAKLTGLEIDKLEAELAEVRATIADLESILASREKRMGILKDEMDEVVKDYGDERRTEIVADEGEFNILDLIADEDVVVTISRGNYIKRIALNSYRKQRRGGKGLTGTDLKAEDAVSHLFIAKTHDYLLFFTNQGRVYWLRAHEVPEGSRTSKGKPIVHCIEMKPDETIASVLSTREFPETQALIFATRNGTVKKTVLAQYGNVRTVGLIAINIEAGDELIDVQMCEAGNDVVLATQHGMSIRFAEKDVRATGRDTMGVKGISLRTGDAVIGMVVVRRDGTLLVISEKGYGKRSDLAEYRIQNRGGKGIITFNVTDKTGRCMAMLEVTPGEGLMLITQGGIIIRTDVDGIRIIGRNTQGVKVMNLEAGDKVVDVARVFDKDEESSAEVVEDAESGSEGAEPA
jgi:DNA gyrase subunit A